MFIIIYSRRAPVLKTFHLHLSQHKFPLNQRTLRLYWPRGMSTVKTSKPLYNYFSGWICPFFRTHNCCCPVIIICQNFWKTMVTNVASCYKNYYSCVLPTIVNTKKICLPTLLYVYHLLSQIKIYSMARWVSVKTVTKRSDRCLICMFYYSWNRVLVLIWILSSLRWLRLSLGPYQTYYYYNWLWYDFKL